jgi:hypothetical protein
MLLAAVAPELLDGYRRYYLAQAGVRPDAADTASRLRAFDRTFALPPVIREAVQRQVDIVLSGI